MTGKTIAPGFVDTHAHLRVTQRHSPRPAVELRRESRVRRDDGARSADGQHGRAHVRGSGEGRHGARAAHLLHGPGVFAAENIRNLDDARTVLRRYAEYYDTKTIKQYQTGNREVRQWVIQAANELKLMPTTEGGLDIKMNITEAIDGYSGHEHSIPTSPLQSDVIRLIAESGMAYTPTIVVAYGSPWVGELLVPEDGPAQRREAAAVHAVERSRRQDPAPRRFTGRGDDDGPGGVVPRVAVRDEADGRRREEAHRRRRHRRRGLARPAAGPRLPLGAVEHRHG